MVIVALLSVLSFLLMAYIKLPIIPGAIFLKLDFSIIPALFVGYFLGSGYGILLLLIRSILMLTLISSGPDSLIGQPVNFVLGSIFIAVFVALVKNHRWLAGIVSTTILIISAAIINYFFAVPLYAKFVHFDISQQYGIKNYLLAIILPFNLIQGIIWSLIFFLIFPYIFNAFKRLQ